MGHRSRKGRAGPATGPATGRATPHCRAACTAPAEMPTQRSRGPARAGRALLNGPLLGPGVPCPPVGVRGRGHSPPPPGRSSRDFRPPAG
eukprot:scaffold106873_cov45-Phaeocystis_antarctica.AAC.1